MRYEMKTCCICVEAKYTGADRIEYIVDLYSPIVVISTQQITDTLHICDTLFRMVWHGYICAGIL